MEVAFTTAQSAGRSGAPTPDDRLEGRRDGGGRGVRVRVGGGWGDSAGRTEHFLSIDFSFCHPFRRRRGEGVEVSPQGSTWVAAGLHRTGTVVLVGLPSPPRERSKTKRKSRGKETFCPPRVEDSYSSYLLWRWLELLFHLHLAPGPVARASGVLKGYPEV